MSRISVLSKRKKGKFLDIHLHDPVIDLHNNVLNLPILPDLCFFKYILLLNFLTSHCLQEIRNDIINEQVQ